jgi:hypothetical protein
MKGEEQKFHDEATGTPGRKTDAGASEETKRWVAWRKAMRAATIEDRRVSILERAERDQRIAGEYHNPAAVWAGLIVLAFLLVGGWFLIDAMSCDPFYSDIGLSRSRACR